LGILLAVGCSEATLQNYKAQNVEEDMIKQVLARFQDAINAADPAMAQELLHRDLKAMIDSNRRIVSRKEYLEGLSTRMAGRPLSVFGAPQIALQGNRADVSLTMISAGVKTPLLFQFVREEGRWLILGWQY